MSEEKSQAKLLQEKLFNNKKHGVDFMSDAELEKCDDFCEGYKEFLQNNKTEREVTSWADKVAQENGFVPFDEFGGELEAVSYTHLDVYKRQVYNSSFLYLRKFNI